MNNQDEFHEGYERGLEMAVPDFSSAEKIDLLIEMMASLIGEPSGKRYWMTLVMMSEINSAQMIAPENSWHLRWKADRV